MLSLFSFLLVCGSLTYAVIAGEEKKSAVVELTRHNFDEVVLDKDKHVLVKFFAPWCGHCKRLEPVWENLARTFEAEDDCIVARIDAEYESSLGARYGVRGFPTIKFFGKGDKMGEAYDGDRTEVDFMEYLNEKCGTNRIKGGAMNNRAGRIDAFDSFAEKFMNDATYNRSAALESMMRTAEAEVDAGYKKSMQYYVKVIFEPRAGCDDNTIKLPSFFFFSRSFVLHLELKVIKK